MACTQAQEPGLGPAADQTAAAGDHMKGDATGVTASDPDAATEAQDIPKREPKQARCSLVLLHRHKFFLLYRMVRT